MARPLPIQYPGAVYHVMARGSHGQAIFADDKDRQRFLETLAETCQKTGWRVHAYVLMGSGPARRAHDEAAAELNLVKAMRALGLNEESLTALPKGSPEKAVLAWWLRGNTTVAVRWVSQRLDMGHYTRVTQAISRVAWQPNRRHKNLKRKLTDLTEKP